LYKTWPSFIIFFKIVFTVICYILTSAIYLMIGGFYAIKAKKRRATQESGTRKK
jgi:hypothetical protein